MSAQQQSYHRIAVRDVDVVTIVTFVDRNILDHDYISQMGDELYALVEQDGCRRILISFLGVNFFSAAALNKLLILSKKLSDRGGRLAFCGMSPEIYEVFSITRLNQWFSIKDDEPSALQLLAN